ncbi:hypothetical protein GCM10009616_35090 [Microlunatus lacustris]
MVRALDDYLAGRTTGRTYHRSSRRSRLRPPGGLHPRLGRLCRDVGLSAGVTPHSPGTPTPPSPFRLGPALQDVQDARSRRPAYRPRYDRSRYNLDRSPNYPLAAALTVTSAKDSDDAWQDAR